MTSGGTVLIIGSAPDAVQCQTWDRTLFSSIVAINNAWRVRQDWDYLVFPEDFSQDRLPPTVSPHQRFVEADEYVIANNVSGGIFYAGATMAFTAGYWALTVLRPSVLAFVGCDMIYSGNGQTHFYGTGAPDPLRKDLSLRNLEAKSARLMLHAERQGTHCVRLSSGESRLVFPSIEPGDLPALERGQNALSSGDEARFDILKEDETHLGYFVRSGRYWEECAAYSVAEIDALDRRWLEAVTWEGRKHRFAQAS